MTTLNTIESTVKSDLSWLQKHERLIIVFLVLLFGAWGINSWINSDAKKADAQAQIALQQLADQKVKDAAAATQVAELTTQYQQLVAMVSQENAQLALAIQQRNTALQKQQATDQSMTPPQLATRWVGLVSANPSDITALPTGGLAVTQTAALNTVEQLEQVPILQLNLTNETTIAASEQQEVTKANTLNGALGTQVTGLQSTITQEEATCKAQIASVKADASKSKVRWFKTGFVIGFISGIFTGHYL